MSQIDEAFIQAYATPRQPTAVPGGAVPLAPPAGTLAGLHRGPHIHMPPAEGQTSEQVLRQTPVETHSWAPEPVPTPHFHAPNGVGQENTLAPVGQVAEAVQLAATAPGIERRPLSTFSAPAQPSTTAFDPVFEVDAFRWPTITEELLDAHHTLLMPVVEQLLEVSEQGRSLVGIAGARPNVGCTTLQLCLARLIANAGKSVVLVDANFSEASLARDLGLEFESGWEDVLTGRVPLAECVVKSLHDRMALLPLARPCDTAEQMLASIQTSVTAGVLRYHYDVVLFNLGAAGQQPQWAAAQSIVQHCRLDASLIIADTEGTGDVGTAEIDPLMSLLGPTCLGVIGNSAAA